MTVGEQRCQQQLQNLILSYDDTLQFALQRFKNPLGVSRSQVWRRLSLSEVGRRSLVIGWKRHMSPITKELPNDEQKLQVSIFGRAVKGRARFQACTNVHGHIALIGAGEECRA